MPDEGLEWLPRSEILSFAEISRLAGVMASHLGLRSVRLTGGEPTLRAKLPRLVAMLAELGVDISMTTNGATLPQLAQPLKDAGLSRINISLDTLRAERFFELTRRNQLDEVVAGIKEAVAVGFEPVKLNVVLMNGINDDEVVDFLRFGRSTGVTVRFIEFMPLDAQGEWSADRVVPAADILAAASKEFDFERVDQGSSPAAPFCYSDDIGGEFGIIASVSEPFCGSCDRVRLTAEGQLRNCLFALEHLDVRALLRDGSSDEQIVKAIRGEVDRKWAGHAIGEVHFVRPSKSMSQVGG